MVLNRNQLLGMTKRRFRNVAIPDGIELANGDVTQGLQFRIRSLTERELATLETSGIRVTKSGEKIQLSESEMQRQRRHTLCCVLVDESGNTLLSKDDEEALCDLDGAIAQLIYTEALEFCGLKDSRENAEKNFGGTRVAGGTVNSQGGTDFPT